MTLQKALVSMSQQFTGLPMGDLIGAPLMAAAEANSAMAVTQSRFILDTCFQEEKNKDDVQYNAVGIQMDIAKGNDSKVTTSLNLPLLTIIPLNSLAVDDVNVNFHREAESASKEKEASKTQRREFSQKEKFIQQQIPCPECNHPIPFNISALLEGASFKCSNYDCDVSIKLSPESISLAKQTHDDFINLKANHGSK